MTTMTISEQDIDAIEQDARSRADELREQRSRLSLDALTDQAAADELANVESELRSAEGVVDQTDRARAEVERRVAQAVEDAAQANRERLQAELDLLDAECRPLAEACDEMLQAAAGAIKAYVDVFARRQSTRTELQIAQGERTVGGGGGVGPPLERAMLFHLIEHGPGRVVRFDSRGGGDLRPLADCEPTPAKEKD